MPYSFIFFVTCLLAIIIFNKRITNIGNVVFYILLITFTLLGFFVKETELVSVNINIIFTISIITNLVYLICVSNKFQITISVVASVIIVGVYLILINYNGDNIFAFNPLYITLSIFMILFVCCFDLNILLIISSITFIAIQITDMNYLVNEIGFASGFNYTSLNYYTILLSISIGLNLIYKVIKTLENRKKWILKEKIY